METMIERLSLKW